MNNLGNIEILVRFENKRFTFTHDYIGKNFDLSLKGNNLVICFPDFPIKDFPHPTFINNKLKCDWEKLNSSHISFGKPISWNENTKCVDLFELNSMLITSKNPITKKESFQIKNDLENWK